MKRPQRLGDMRLSLVILGIVAMVPTACTTTSASTGMEEPSTARSQQADASDASDGLKKGDSARSSHAQRAEDSGDPDADAGPQGPALEMAKTSIRPQPVDITYEMEVKVNAALTPPCVKPGSEMSVEVTTEPEASIAYHAVYAGNKGGSGPPFGEGYGGNDKGAATTEGSYESTWLVRADTPPGPARVDVVVGYEGEFGYVGPHFAVADERGNCPSRWLKSGPDRA